MSVTNKTVTKVDFRGYQNRGREKAWGSK